MPRRIEVTQTTKSITNIAEELERCAASLRAIATAMEIQRIEALEVPNHAGMILGMGKIQSFAAGAKLALLDAQQQRGDFGGKAPPDVAKKPRKPVSGNP